MLWFLYRGIPDYGYKKGTIKFIRTARQVNNESAEVGVVSIALVFHVTRKSENIIRERNELPGEEREGNSIVQGSTLISWMTILRFKFPKICQKITFHVHLKYCPVYLVHVWYLCHSYYIFFSRRRNHSKHFLVRVSLSGRKEGDERRPESVLFISILYMISVTGLFWEEGVYHCVSHTLLWHCFMNASEFEW